MFKKLLKKLAKYLSKYRIPYMIIGGQAVLYYGEPRLTKDIDVTLGITINEIALILKLVKATGLLLRIKDPVAFAKKTMVIPAFEKISGIGIDFIFSNSPYERQAIKKAKKVHIDKVKLNIAALEDVIIHKLIAGRPRDIEDIRSIILKNPKYDKRYIVKWLKKFDGLLNTNYTICFRSLIENL
ncbi:hypothetical protein A2Y85_02100 [candidate division WOR-3 bacterium RBG_13_43_14]|uniref:Nucleotidyl transferase AbiEii/AbiGii toxin family protein n=1 Tax=candidate division WOR-3 bacterium RBG_13_43_14 TaxID=1802590 RepID=A0A1F4UAR1_UNCW3|nr:MAG: hypothetical protein A2Y85_02100 [candidate division WOR-3 bacterium RBG_13_43_14]